MPFGLDSPVGLKLGSSSLPRMSSMWPQLLLMETGQANIPSQQQDTPTAERVLEPSDATVPQARHLPPKVQATPNNSQSPWCSGKLE